MGWTDLTEEAGITNIDITDPNNKTLDYKYNYESGSHSLRKIAFLQQEKQGIDFYFEKRFAIANASLDVLESEESSLNKIETFPIPTSCKHSLVEFVGERIAILQWSAFFERHQITDREDQLVWKSREITPKTLEDVYTNAISSLTLDSPLTETEKEKINLAKTPAAVAETVKKIPQDRFFDGKQDIENREN